MFSKDMEANTGLDETLGGRIIEAREGEELSTAQLARRIGVKTETLAHGNRTGPSPDRISS